MGIQVLVIEDNPELVDLYRQALEMIGCEVTAITDGKQALTQLDVAQPDMIILDMNLPNVSGHYLYKKLRADAELDGTVVVISTANRIVARAIEDEMANGDHLLQKPISVADLQAIVKAIDAKGTTNEKPSAD